MILLLIFTSWICVVSSNEILCIGDSITHGTGSSSPKHSYPNRLQEILNISRHSNIVYNFGVKLASAQRIGTHVSYWNTAEYKNSISHKNTVSAVIIQLGANDAYFSHWNESRFVADYSNLAQEYKKLTPNVYLAIPPPVLGWLAVKKINQTVTNKVFPLLIPVIAKSSECKGVIDLQTPMLKEEWVFVSDGVSDLKSVLISYDLISLSRRCIQTTRDTKLSLILSTWQSKTF